MQPTQHQLNMNQTNYEMPQACPFEFIAADPCSGVCTPQARIIYSEIDSHPTPLNFQTRAAVRKCAGFLGNPRARILMRSGNAPGKAGRPPLAVVGVEFSVDQLKKLPNGDDFSSTLVCRIEFGEEISIPNRRCSYIARKALEEYKLNLVPKISNYFKQNSRKDFISCQKEIISLLFRPVHVNEQKSVQRITRYAEIILAALWCRFESFDFEREIKSGSFYPESSAMTERLANICRCAFQPARVDSTRSISVLESSFMKNALDFLLTNGLLKKDM